MQKEVEAAQEVQTRLMPRISPPLGNYEIHGHCQPAFDVGGDHFDYFWFDQKKQNLGLVLVDVEGKRMRGAFPSTWVNGMLKMVFEVEGRENLSVLFAMINRHLTEKMGGELCVSLILGQLDLTKNRFTFVNSGCPSPLMKRNGSVFALQEVWQDFRPALGMVGVMDENKIDEANAYFKKHTCQFDRNSVLLIFSDGLIELKDETGQLYGERLKSLTADIDNGKSAYEISRVVFDDLLKFNAGQELRDDQTMIVIKRCDG